MNTVNSFFSAFQAQIVTPIITLLIFVAFVVFIAGVIQYIGSPQDEKEAKENSRRLMLYGIIGFVIIFGANAIVRIIQGLVSFL